MGSFRLLNYAGDSGEARAGILAGGNSVIDLQRALPDKAWTVSTLSILDAWDEARPALHALADAPPSQILPLASVRLLAPLLYPPAIYCTGANYMDHAEEMSAEKKGVDKATTQPYLFLKSGPHCVIGPGDAIRLPNVSDNVDWEGEFAVVIGKRARNVSVDNAMQYAHVSSLIFNVPELIEYLSRRMTLLPGDVIATGTPAGVGRPKGTFLKPGDVVRIEISDIGVLENRVEQGE